MAEIKIEKKAPIWPWILGLLLLMAIGAGIYYATLNDNEVETEVVADEIPENEITPQETGADSNTLPAEVSAFIAFAEEDNPYAEGEMEIHHRYTGDALRKMGNALEALANKKGMADKMNIRDVHSKLDKAADEIQKNWKETDHADHIKKAFLMVSGTLNQLADGSTNEDLRKEAQDIDPNTLTLEQKADVKDFINKTAKVMNQLAMED